MIIGSIGVGLLILILVWIVALIIFVVGVKIQSNIAWIALGSATVLTAILVLIPTEKSPKPARDLELQEKDYGFVYRTIFLAFLALCAAAAAILFFILHCIVPIRPKPITQFYQSKY